MGLNQFQLITTLYNEKDINRVQEYIYCLEKNLENPLISQIHIFYDSFKDGDTKQLYIKDYLSKQMSQQRGIFVRTIKGRPTYEDIIKYANRYFINFSKVIVSNADIYFNFTLEKFFQLDFKNKFFVLTRWEQQDNTQDLQLLYDGKGLPNYLSADAWIFEVPLTLNFRCNYKLGLWDCDSLLNNQLLKSNLKIYNPCIDIQCIHIDKQNKVEDSYIERKDNRWKVWLEEFRKNNCQNPVAGIPWCTSQEIEGAPPKFYTWKEHNIILKIEEEHLEDWQQFLIICSGIILSEKMDRNIWILETNISQLVSYFLSVLPNVYKLQEDRINILNSKNVFNENHNLEEFEQQITHDINTYRGYINKDIYLRVWNLFSHEWILEEDLREKVQKYQNYLAYEYGQDQNFYQLLDLIEKLKEFHSFTKIPYYNFLIELSWQDYQKQKFNKMKENLIQSLNYSPYIPSKTVIDWFEQWTSFARKQGKKLNINTVKDTSEWQNAVCAALSKDILPKNKWTPIVSIITSVFQGDKYIKPFLEDITQQTIFERCELILVNPNSPGNEEETIKEYLNVYSNIIYKKLDLDPGLYEVWNLAIRIARGKYITNANLDDRRSPNHIEEHVKILEKHSEIDTVCAPLKVTYNPNETWENNSAHAIWYEGFPEYFGRSDLFKREEKTGEIKSQNIPHCMPVWRKELHWKHGFFNEIDYGSCADWEFWLRCASRGSKYFLLRTPLGLYLEDPDSYNRKFPDKDKAATKKILDEYYEFQSEENNFEQGGSNLFSSNISCCLKKLNLSTALKYEYGKHRSGWGYVVNCLSSLHDNRGIFVDTFLEKKFFWGTDPGDAKNNPEPYTEPWIGFIHCPVDAPTWFLYEQTPQKIFETSLWQQSLLYCKGIFCLSNHQKQWLQEKLNVPVSNLIHPTEFPELKFSMDNFLGNKHKKIVQIGWWLRKLNSIYYLPVRSFEKAILPGQNPSITEISKQEKKNFLLTPNLHSVESIRYLSNEEYDRLLAENIIYIELYDSVANNTIIECIVRNTPILVNPLPSVVEYLGEDYPFYFTSKKEAAEKAEDFSLIEKTHDYLKNHSIKRKLTSDYFIASILNSEVYRSI